MTRRRLRPVERLVLTVSTVIANVAAAWTSLRTPNPNRRKENRRG